MPLRKCLFQALQILWLASVLTGISRAQQEPTHSYDGWTVRRLSLQTDGPLTRITPADIFKLLEIEEGEPYTPSLARNSIQRLYSSQIFHDVEITAEPVADRLIDVEVVLIRKYVIEQVEFTGSVALDRNTLRRELALRVHEPYRAEAQEETMARLTELYRNEGYYQPRIEPAFELDHERALIRVRFEIEAGRQAHVSSLNFSSEGEVDLAQIRKLMRTEQGGLYSEVAMEADIKRVERYFTLQGFLNPLVYVRDGAQYDDTTNSVALTLRILPREFTRLRFEGIDPEDQRIQDLPLFAEAGTAEIFLQESADRLLEKLQKDGYFQASTDFQLTGSGADREISLKVVTGKKLSLREIGFEDNSFADSRTLLLVVRTRKERFFNRGDFTKATVQEDSRRIESYYQQRGFLDASVSWRVEPTPDDGIRVVFTIREGERYTVENFSIVGNEELSEELLLQEIQTRQGEPFSPVVVAQDRANVIALYENRGYRQVDFRSEISRPKAGLVSVQYLIREGPQLFVDQVIITGNRDTKDPVLERNIEIQAGQPLSLGQILRTESNLYNLTVFNRVEIKEVPSFRDPSSRTILINLEEAKKYTLFYGIGYSSFEGARGTFGITDSNFLGMARSLSFSLRVGARRQRANLSYTLPRPFQFQLPTVLSVTADNQKALTRSTGFNSRAIQGRPFDALRLTASSQSEYRLSRRESLFFRYQFERVELNVPPDLASPLEFFREEERLRLSSASLSYLNESRDDPINPTQGFFLSGDVMGASRFLGSGAELLRLFAQVQYYYPLRPRLIWVSSLRAGFIQAYGRTDSVPISERFFSGGSTTLRGLPQDLAGPILTDPETGEVVLVNDRGEPDPNGRPVPLGGDALMIFNSELRFPIAGIFSGAAFYDVGNVYESIGDVFSTRVSHTLGFGVHIRTPVGPIRLDAGFNPNPPDAPGFKHWNFHINLGHPF